MNLIERIKRLYSDYKRYFLVPQKQKNIIYRLYRCRVDGKLIFPKDFPNHAGHKVDIATNGNILEWVMIKIKKFRGELEKREHWQN